VPFDRNARDPVRVRRALQELAESETILFNETPGGTVNGTNAAFSLQNPPRAGTLLLRVNGLTQLQGADYSLAGGTITFLAGSIPQTGDWLRATYEA
jgi:hypothetical protein